MMILALLARPWLLSTATPTTDPRSLADDLQTVSHGTNNVQGTINATLATHTFLTKLSAKVATTKSVLFASRESDRPLLRDYVWPIANTCIKVYNTFRDLVSHMNLTLAGGSARAGLGGDVYVRTGQSIQSSSGSAFISTSNAGLAGVSGSLNLGTGTSSVGGSGSVLMSTGGASYGRGGTIVLSVGSGDSGEGGNVRMVAGGSLDQAGGHFQMTSGE